MASLPENLLYPGLPALNSIGLAGPGLAIPYFTDEPKYPSYFYPTPSSGPYRKPAPYGLSLVRDPSLARLKALAEFYERLCLHNAAGGGDPEPWRPGADADPASFADPSRQICQRLREAPYRWMPAVSVHTGKATRVPAQVVIPDFDPSDEPAIIPKIGSSGAALGARGDGGALARGLFEVIERHCCRDFRFETTTAERIVDLPGVAAEIEANLRRYRLGPYIFRISDEFGVPVVACALTDSSGVGPAVSVAKRAAPTWEQAIEDVLTEALERRRPARLERSRGEPANPVYAWSTLDRLRQVQPALDRAPRLPFAAMEPVETTPQALLAELRHRDFDVLQVDLTLPEVAAAGFEAIKILVPGLGPLPA